MEGSPDEIDTNQLLKDIKNLKEGAKIHDFHLWQISVGKLALSAHVTYKDNLMIVLKEVTSLVKTKYKIDHVKIQIEHLSNDNKYKLQCK